MLVVFVVVLGIYKLVLQERCNYLGPSNIASTRITAVFLLTYQLRYVVTHYGFPSTGLKKMAINEVPFPVQYRIKTNAHAGKVNHIIHYIIINLK